jgi:hypothetical protein
MTYKKRKIKKFKSLSAVIFVEFLAIGTGSGSSIRKNAGSGSGINQCGSETLQKTHVNVSYKHKCWEEKRRVKG